MQTCGGGKSGCKAYNQALILGLDGVEKQINWFSKTEPTEEHLVTAMEMYARGLKSNPRFGKIYV